MSTGRLRNPSRPKILSLYSFVKRRIERIKIAAVKVILRDAEGIGEFTLSNKRSFSLVP